MGRERGHLVIELRGGDIEAVYADVPLGLTVLIVDHDEGGPVQVWGLGYDPQAVQEYLEVIGR